MKYLSAAITYLSLTILIFAEYKVDTSKEVCAELNAHGIYTSTAARIRVEDNSVANLHTYKFNVLLMFTRI